MSENFAYALLGVLLILATAAGVAMKLGFNLNFKSGNKSVNKSKMKNINAGGDVAGRDIKK